MSVPALARGHDASVRSSAAPSPGRSTIAATPAQPVVREHGIAGTRRRRHHLGFVLFASVVVGLLVFGLVTLNAFVAQSSFRIDHLQARVDERIQRYQALERRAARLSAPGRIAAWARRHAMRPPEDVSVLHVPRLRASGLRASGLRVSGPGGTSVAGGPDEPSRGRSLEPIVEGGG